MQMKEFQGSHHKLITSGILSSAFEKFETPFDLL